MKIKDWEKMTEFAVINDFGNDWETAKIVSRHPTYQEAFEWAEDQNYHSASIVELDHLGKRIKKVR